MWPGLTNPGNDVIQVTLPCSEKFLPEPRFSFLLSPQKPALSAFLNSNSIENIVDEEPLLVYVSAKIFPKLRLLYFLYRSNLRSNGPSSLFL